MLFVVHPNDWLEDEIIGLKNRGITCLISMLEYSEVWDLGLIEEEGYCEKWGVEYINFPIEDVNIPRNEDKFIAFAKNIANRIIQKDRIVIHCRMGIGRASMMAAAIMIKLGYKGTDVFLSLIHI